MKGIMFMVLAAMGLFLGAIDVDLIANGYPERTLISAIGGYLWTAVVFGGVFLAVAERAFERWFKGP